MKSSARNQFAGQILEILPMGSMCQVAVQSGAHVVYALISQRMADNLGIKVGDTAIVMVKASAVMLLTDIMPFRLATENGLNATVQRIETGAVNNIITLSLSDGLTLTAAITLHSSERLDLHCGQAVYAAFHAHQTVLAVL